MKTRHIFITVILLLTACSGYLAGQAPSGPGLTEKGKVTAAKTQMAAIKIALDSFEIDNGHYPAGGDLDALVHAPANAPDWHGPYLGAVPVDPWGHPYIYLCPGKHNPNGFDLSSMGPDGKEATADDITNW